MSLSPYSAILSPHTASLSRRNASLTWHVARSFAACLVLTASLVVSGCRAQVPAPGKGPALTPELTRRIELMIRTKASLPFNYSVRVGDRRPGSIAGFDEITVFLGEEGKPMRPMTFLISTDNQTLAQMNTFDISKDPRTLTTDAGRPARGGDGKAPVTIVVFDDLECPFCSRMHSAMFPAILNRYGKNVRIAYKDFPLFQIHPWAEHAAVDADCLADQSQPGYWNLVDYMHSHLDDIGLDPALPAAPGKEPQKTLDVAVRQIDKLTMDEGRKQKVDSTRLEACIRRQDLTAVHAGEREGDSLNVSGVPALFVNGQQITGAVPIEYVYRAVDQALTAQGITPPPPVPLPSEQPSPQSAPAASPATK